MKQLLQAFFALTFFAFLASPSVLANDQEKMIIALKTSDFELAETDISTLAVGESQTIETQSGRVIDILRTVDGAEIYVDGSLLDMGDDHEGLHEGHEIKKHVEVICEDGQDCDEMVWVSEDSDIELEELHQIHEGEKTHKVIVIKKDILKED